MSAPGVIVHGKLALENRGTRQSWIVCISAALFFFYEFIQMNMLGAISEEITKEFALSPTQLGFFSNAYLLADSLFIIPAGLILDRYHARKVILISMILAITGALGFALSHSVLLAAFFHALSGACNAFCFLSCIMLATQWFPPKQHATVIGIIITIAFIGGLVSQAPFSILVCYLGWRPAVLVDVILGLVCLAIIWKNVSDVPPHMINPNVSVIKARQRLSLLQSLAGASREMRNWTCGIYTSLMNYPILVLDALWGGMYLSHVHDLSIRQATWITSMIFIGSIVGCPLVGYLSDRYEQKRRFMIIGASCSLLTVGVIMMATSLSYLDLLLLFFCLGLFTSTQILTFPIITNINPSQFTATATAIASVIIMGGAFLAQPLFGWLMEYYWDGTIIDKVRVFSNSDYHVALMILPIGFIVSLVLALNLRYTK